MDFDVDAFDDEVTFEYTVIPAGKGDVALVPVTSATVAGRSYRVELDGETVSAEILIDPSTLRAVGYTCW